MNEHIIFGRNAVEEALRAGGRVNRLFLSSESRAPWTDPLADLAKAQQARVELAPMAKLNRLAHSRDHQGVVAFVSPVAHISLDQCLANCQGRTALLALDGVANPRNLGMLLRTALGAGVAGVLLPVRGGALMSEDVVRASAGAALRVPVVHCPNMARALRTLKDADFWVYGLDAAGDTDVFGLSWASRTVLVVGNETEGLRPVIRKRCDAMVRIPLASRLDSLNVSVAAGIALFQVTAHHRREAKAE